MKGLQRSHTRGKFAGGASHSGTITIAGVALVVDGAAGVGFGAVQISDFPQGNILFLGCVAYLTFTGAGGQGGLVDTWEGDFSIGTTPTADATLTGTDADIVESSVIGAATAEVSPRTRGVGDTALAGVIFDNTDGTLEINANVIVDDAHISADTMLFTIDGELYIKYMVLGDD